MKKFEEIMAKVLPYIAAGTVIAVIGFIAMALITLSAAIPMMFILGAAFL